MVKKRIRSGGPSADGCENGRAVRRPVRLLLLAFSVLLGACSATAPSPSPLSTSVPTLAPTEGPTPTPALSPGSSGGALDLAMAAAIAEVEAAVPPLRGLELRAEVPNRILDAAGLHAELLRLFDEAATPAEYAAQSRFGERMGLLPAGSDLRALQLALFEEQALGFYDQDTRQMTLVERGSGTFGPLERATLAHEYTHALQDQHFGLADLGLDDLTQGDRALARLALIEGDASLLMQQWAAENLSFADAMKVLLQALDPRQQAVLAGMPPILQRQLMFPYLDGLAFVTGLQAAGGWTAVDAAYSRPPDSTEQILHPEKYTVGEGPVAVTPADELGRLGVGWTETLADTLGELTISVWLEPAAGTKDAAAAAAGWGGDRVTMYEGPDRAWLIAWSTAWDTPADAAEFATAAAASRVRGVRVVGGGPVAATDRIVLVVLSSDADLLDRLYPPTR